MYLSSISELSISKITNLESEGTGYFIMIAEKHVDELPILLQKMKVAKFHFFGGVFPRLIMGTQLIDKGLLFVKVPLKESIVLNWNEVEESRYKIENHVPQEGESVVILTDGAYPKNSSSIRKFFKGKSGNVQYVGAGAGLLSFEQKPCVFNETGAYCNASIMAILSCNIKTGIKHGWTPIEGPIVANSTSLNVINELNWQPAIDVYSNAIKKISGETISADNFSDIAKSYPFGIYKASHEYIVRDPMALEADGEIKCIAEIPENSVIHVLHGDKESLLAAAESAAKESVKNVEPVQALVFDCITRVLFLEEDYKKELLAIDHELEPFGITAMGACVMGEICQENQSQLELFNKTVIVASLF